VVTITATVLAGFVIFAVATITTVWAVAAVTALTSVLLFSPEGLLIVL
jgi:hypothetical protein